MNRLRDFIDSFGGSALAERVGVSKGTVSSWRNGRWRVPAERCRELELISGGAVTRYDMRPDVFGPAPTERAA